jgi:hypothetical protein
MGPTYDGYHDTASDARVFAVRMDTTLKTAKVYVRTPTAEKNLQNDSGKGERDPRLANEGANAQ